MSENSSDSDSSCGWTVISHEGSDIEAVASEHEGPGSHLELGLEDASSLLQENDQQEQPVDLQADFGQADASSVGDQGCSASETVQAIPEEEKEKPPEESSCVGAVSDDSDIVTLDTPKAEGTGSPEELAPAEEEEEEEETHVVSEDFNMGSSSSSQYTFCPPETVFPAQASGEEPGSSSSSDESRGRHTSPALRRRRPKKRAASSSESEQAPLPPPPHEEDVGQGKDPSCKPPLGGGGLNRCILLALLIAISMGFGHFYGTVQVQKRQQWVEKVQEDGRKEMMKVQLVEWQHERHGGGGGGDGGKAECRSLEEGLANCLLATEKEKEAFESQKGQLASENLRLRESLEKEEAALALLQEELRKLREKLRALEGSPEESPEASSENQELKAHLEEEREKRQSLARQKEALLAEAQMLRRELDKERQLTGALREEMGRLSAQQQQEGAPAEGFLEDPETTALRGRLAELEKKLSFEKQRSDLWEKLYVEAKDQVEEKEKKSGWLEKGRREEEEEERPWAGGRWSSRRGQAKPKATFFSSVKETFDAMKNSTKEFVRHHKQKIKAAKEAVKENLRKFSDSVKSTFRHFKDTTKDIFREGGKERHGSGRRRDAKRRKGPAAAPGAASQAAHRAPGDSSPKGFGRPRPGSRASPPPECSGDGGGKTHRQAAPQGCTGIFDCAHQEFSSLFNKVLDPIRADEFNQLVHKYLHQQVGDFHHWRELEAFVGRFFRNGVFIHDQMLFTDFVHDVQDYLGDMEEYQQGQRSHSRGGGGAFEGLDDYIYHYFFRYDPSPQHGPHSHPADKAPLAHSQRTQTDRRTPKPQPRAKREGRWQQHEGRSSGRQMARLKIEVGQMPFDPKY